TRRRAGPCRAGGIVALELLGTDLRRTCRPQPSASYRTADSGGQVPRRQEPHGFRLEVQRSSDRPRPDRAVGHRRVPPPPREPRDGWAKWRRKKPSLAGAGPPLL